RQICRLSGRRCRRADRDEKIPRPPRQLRAPSGFATERCGFVSLLLAVGRRACFLFIRVRGLPAGVLMLAEHSPAGFRTEIPGVVTRKEAHQNDTGRRTRPGWQVPNGSFHTVPWTRPDFAVS